MADRQMLVAPAAVRDGSVFLAKRDAFDRALSTWPDCQVVMRVEEALDPRGASLNAYYWGGVVDLVSEHTGFTPAETHRELKALHLPHRLHVMRGGAVCFSCAQVLDGSTRRMSSREEWRYIERCHIWAASELGVVIPDPEAVS